MNDDEPKWELLPHRPMEFFELETGFDRTDLKRAYNRWIKRFKPDKFPTEFQRIRGAFELLDGNLRYGQDTQPPTIPIRWERPEDGWGTPAPGTPASLSHEEIVPSEITTYQQPIEVPVPKSPLGVLQEQLAKEPPDAIYRQLTELETKQPFHFYALAVLSDIATRDRSLFAKWLVVGLKAYPEDANLRALLREHFMQGHIEAAEMRPLLINLVAIIRDDHFFYFTEPLWKRYLSCANWKDFESTLSRCEGAIKDHRYFCRVSFFVYLLRKALWKAPMEWSRAKMDFIENHREQSFRHIDFDLDMTSVLFHFVEHCDEFRRRGSIANQIADCLRSYCEEDEEISHRKIVECHSRIASAPHELFREFPLEPSVDFDMIHPWIWVSSNAVERLDSDDRALPPEAIDHATFTLLCEIDRSFPGRHVSILNYTCWGIHAAAWVAPIFVGSFIGSIFYASNIPLMIGVSIGLILGVLYQILGAPRVRARMLSRFYHGPIKLYYRKRWRSMTARMFAATHFSFANVRDSMRRVIAKNDARLNVSTWVPHLYPADLGLLMHSISVRFVR